MGAGTFLTRLFKGEAGVTAMKSRRARKIRELPDRKLLAEAYIPAFAEEAGKILWVGCRAYTADDYPVLSSQGGEVWTTDIDPDAARWGVEGRHRTGDICEADVLFGDQMFDAIVCNGVLGFGVDAPDQQRKCLQALSRILRPGGRLLLGWNVDKIGDPIAAALTEPWFSHQPFAGQPARVTFAETTHVYDAFVRRQPAA
ncbi:class I SAM-dependent methyltransferase [Brevundimonas staleyi]|uniref:Class I SAM-dependent methyltransferase n=1 Tax=Brevundimonas staleyi TaxID=74326 RepID=A0ABW0FSC7_9CAUL